MTCKECRNALPAFPGFTHQVLCTHYHLHTGGNAYAGDCNYFEKKAQTNFDRIRAMSVEELAAWIADHPVVVAYDENNPQHKAWLEWLEKEADA